MDWIELTTQQKDMLNEISNGSFELTDHCLVRMSERAVQYADILSAAKTAFEITEQKNKRFQVLGKDRADLDLTLIVEYIEDIVVVTVF